MDSLKADSQVVEVNGNDYWVSDIEQFIESNLEEVVKPLLLFQR